VEVSGRDDTSAQFAAEERSRLPLDERLEDVVGQLEGEKEAKTLIARHATRRAHTEA
jgi:hypothetical protein